MSNPNFADHIVGKKAPEGKNNEANNEKMKRQEQVVLKIITESKTPLHPH